MKAAVLIAFLCLWRIALPFKICAFNIRSFGETKASNKNVMDILVKIITRCDVCLIQEVRDSKGKVIPALVKELNRFDEVHSYAFVESDRVGKKSYKEQYVYIFRDDVLQVRDQYQYPTSQKEKADVFSREPFIVRFHCPQTAVKDFVLVGHHTCPKTAMQEIDELFQVFQGIKKHWRTRNVMFLGDLNAACSYVSAKCWDTISLRKNPDFHWLIGDEEDTTVSEKTHCAYDRIVVHGTEFLNGIVPKSARPFNFKKEFHLSEKQALEVSDHYPVEVNLKPNSRYLHRHEL
ncbi:deoxyribonuclease I-like 1-like isoform X1 [Lepisosteus oculatus]|nr:PREDICTED: deoxyribonuclease gamma-like isoform X1 [Lepisosteus oculatus]XP_015198060.1 PREDICTED: deoxyribonuclease gamma-like isoform X1 [Lepisosteus oculatus]